MEFKYEPLPPESVTIRILELHPGRNGDSITCNLQQCSFPPANGDSYEPLSYCWGDGTDRLSITVDGCSIEVTKNLHAALDQLRLLDKKRRLWVDAICINQDDDIEKTKQVQIMREIYTRGKETLLWLGPGLPNSYINKSWDLIPRIVNGTFTNSITDAIKNWISLGHYNHIPGLFALFSLPYFRRVWVIQEVAASPLVRVYYSANASCSWDDLEFVLKSIPNWGHYSFDAEIFTGFFEKISAARNHFQTKARPGLLQLLEDHRYASATLIKDKIYGLLGLLLPEERELYGIIPNYLDKYTAEEAFTATAMSILEATRNLDILSTPRGSETSSASLQLPSWVPDWDRQPTSIPFISFIREPCFTASGSSTSHPIYLPRGGLHMLGLLGFVFDEIDCVGYPAPDAPSRMVEFLDSKPLLVPLWSKSQRQYNLRQRQVFDFPAKCLRARKAWLGMILPLNRETFVTGEPIIEAFYSTLMSLPDNVATEERKSLRKAYERQVGHRTGPSGIFDSAAGWFAYYALRDTIQIFNPPRFVNYRTRLVRTLGRRMFTTKGTYLGLGPKGMQKGDLVALLKGGQVPYVLRPKGEYYEFVGDCYVHGVMRGERYDESRCEQIWLV